MLGRTIILVSHHVQLCAPGASYIVALDNGRVSYAGSSDGFKASGVQASLVQAEQADETTEQDAKEEEVIEKQLSKAESVASEGDETTPVSETSSTVAVSTADGESKSAGEKKKPRKLIEEEKRAVGRIGRDIWKWYLNAVGGWVYWVIFAVAIVAGALSPVAENGWLRFVLLHPYIVS